MTPAVISNLRHMIRLLVFFLNSIFKLKTVAAIFPENNPDMKNQGIKSYRTYVEVLCEIS